MWSSTAAELAHRRANRLGEWHAELLVNLKRFPPKFAGLAAFCGIGGDVPQRPQRLGFTRPITKVSSEGQGLGVILACLLMVANEALNLT